MRQQSFKVSSSTLREVREALDKYVEEVESTNMTESTKKTYLLHAEHFVRWLENDFSPGVRTG